MFLNTDRVLEMRFRNNRVQLNEFFNTLPNDKFLEWSKMKASADDKLNLAEKKMKFVLGRVAKIVGKGENAGYRIDISGS